MRRTYLLDITRYGGFMFWPAKTVTTDMRIRQTVLVLFKRWFGWQANRLWHKNGFMAEAWDHRGNRVMLQQINSDSNYYTKHVAIAQGGVW